VDNARKKELALNAKEQKPRPGIFAVHCTATGERWVAKAPDLDKRKAGLWFQLAMAGESGATAAFPGPELREAWRKHGEAAFVYEVLEEVRDENELLIPALLKEREAHWRKELNAKALI
jgi:hypothetical protein